MEALSLSALLDYVSAWDTLLALLHVRSVAKIWKRNRPHICIISDLYGLSNPWNPISLAMAQSELRVKACSAPISWSMAATAQTPVRCGIKNIEQQAARITASHPHTYHTYYMTYLCWLKDVFIHICADSVSHIRASRHKEASERIRIKPDHSVLDQGRHNHAVLALGQANDTNQNVFQETNCNSKVIWCCRQVSSMHQVQKTVPVLLSPMVHPDQWQHSKHVRRGCQQTECENMHDFSNISQQCL